MDRHRALRQQCEVAVLCIPLLAGHPIHSALQVTDVPRTMRPSHHRRRARNDARDIHDGKAWQIEMRRMPDAADEGGKI